MRVQVVSEVELKFVNVEPLACDFASFVFDAFGSQYNFKKLGLHFNMNENQEIAGVYADEPIKNFDDVSAALEKALCEYESF